MDNFEALKKVVNDGYNKYKACEFGKEALAGLDSLKQAENDLKKTTADLAKERDNLLAEHAKIQTKLKEADEKALFKIQTAEAKANSILSAVDDAVKEAQSKADKKLKETEGRIASKENIEVEANQKAQIALDKLNKIESELEAATARFKALVS